MKCKFCNTFLARFQVRIENLGTKASDVADLCHNCLLDVRLGNNMAHIYDAKSHQRRDDY